MCSQPLKEKNTPLRWEDLVVLSRAQQRRKLLERTASSVAGQRRFWSKVKIGDFHECWEWERSCYSNGYGRFDIAVQKVAKPRSIALMTHRVAYFLTNKNLPDNMCVCHSCDNPKCCNPDHLFLGTQVENLNDMIAKGRKAVGEKVNFAKLKESEVVEIRRLYAAGLTQQAIAAKFKVGRPGISHIVNRVSWKHVL
jgi:hypothetical protein